MVDNHKNSFDNCSNSSLTKQRRNSSSLNGSLTRSIGAISVGDESPNIGAFWKRHLFLLQEQAPKPTVVVCRTDVRTRPFFYSNEYHGLISREMSDKMLTAAGEGSYLVRESQRAPGMYTLCMRFDDVTKNYKLFYDGCHYVGEKRFDTLDDLVADGLISMYIDKHAADYIRRMAEETIYEETPYSQYRRMHEFKNRDALPPSCNNSRYANNQTAITTPSQSRSTSAEPDPQKAHRFKVHTFKGPHWCDYCGNYMWGLVQQGVKCEDCGFAAHRKCEEKIPQDCRPDMKYVRRQFGVDLTTLTMAYNHPVPLVVELCVGEVEKRGLDAEGIYRVSGSHEEIERLRAQFDDDGTADLSKSKIEDINSIAGLLKLFLRQLPQPLITDSVHRELVEAAKRKYEREKYKLSAYGKCLRQLPPAHQATLRLLLVHLHRVAENFQKNKMDAENLARIFTPTLMGNSFSTASMIITQQEQIILQFLIVQNAKIFASDK